MNNLSPSVFDRLVNPQVYHVLKDSMWMRRYKLSFTMWHNLMVCWNIEQAKPVRPYSIKDVKGSLLFLHRRGLVSYTTIWLDDGAEVKSTRISDEGKRLVQAILHHMARIYPADADQLRMWGME